MLACLERGELVSMYSFFQNKGICHRVIKPVNLFLLQNDEVKVIYFGESKDYFYDPNDEDRETFIMATIRETPQYLLPILNRFKHSIHYCNISFYTLLLD